MANKWTPERLKKFQATMRAKKKNGGNGLDHSHQAIIYLKAANRIIGKKRLHELSDAEVYAHLAYKALTLKTS